MENEIFLDEAIKVAAFFDTSSKCMPLKFWRKNGRAVSVKKMGLHFPIWRGSKKIHVFEITDGEIDYRLELDSVRLSWKLVREIGHYDW